jgi:hypothetical protein
VLAHAFDPSGRLVIFDASGHLHLDDRRPELLEHVNAVMATISDPDVLLSDPRPDREQFYKLHLDGKRWLRVVVDFGSEPATVVTAFIQRVDPRR